VADDLLSTNTTRQSELARRISTASESKTPNPCPPPAPPPQSPLWYCGLMRAAEDNSGVLGRLVAGRPGGAGGLLQVFVVVDCRGCAVISHRVPSLAAAAAAAAAAMEAAFAVGACRHSFAQSCPHPLNSLSTTSCLSALFASADCWCCVWEGAAAAAGVRGVVFGGRGVGARCVAASASGWCSGLLLECGSGESWGNVGFCGLSIS